MQQIVVYVRGSDDMQKTIEENSGQNMQQWPYTFVALPSLFTNCNKDNWYGVMIRVVRYKFVQ